MNYLGGKHRQGPIISDLVCEYLKPGCVYIEPFCGAMGVSYRVVEKMPNNVSMILSDAHVPLMNMWKAILENKWAPPDVVTENKYMEIKSKQDPKDPMTAYVGFGMSFGSKYFGGYARNKKGTNYAANLQRSTSLKAKTLLKAKISLKIADYSEYQDVKGAVIYLDPPYFNRTPQSKMLPKFDHNKFWDFARKISTNNTVIITEFIAPDDFISVHNFGDTVVRHHSSKGKDGTCEKIFMLKGKK